MKALHLMLQEALTIKAELEADLQATMSEYKERRRRRVRNEAVNAVQLKLQEALNGKAALQADLQATVSEY